MKEWRQQQRQRLLDERAGLQSAERENIQHRCLQHLTDCLHDVEPGILGLYWPIRGELDCRGLAQSLMTDGWKLALPSINPETRKLDFAHWQPGMAMTTGIWNIPVPAQLDILRPRYFLIPLVGFDSSNYRLGYGGGYYDRTLAAIKDSVVTIGVGMEMGRVASSYPHCFDIPMHKVVTEAGIQTVDNF